VLGLISPGNPLSATGPYGPGAFQLAPMNPALMQQVAAFDPAQKAGLSALEASAGPSAGLAMAGAGQIADTAGGSYLGSNPYLNSMFNAASQGMVNQYRNATAPGLSVAAQQGGVAGGSADRANQALAQFGLGENLSQLAAGIYGQDYEAERGRQLQAASLVPQAQASLTAPGQSLLTAGTVQQGQTQAELDATRANAQLQQEYPFTLTSYLANALGAFTGAGGQTTAGTSK